MLEVKETSKLTVATRDMRNNIEVGKYQLEVQRLKLELSAREQQMKRVETDVEEYKSRVKKMRSSSLLRLGLIYRTTPTSRGQVYGK